MWGVLVRNCDAHKRQVKDSESLQDAERKWCKVIDETYLKTLYQSLQTGFVAVIERRGPCEDY